MYLAKKHLSMWDSEILGLRKCCHDDVYVESVIPDPESYNWPGERSGSDFGWMHLLARVKTRHTDIRCLKCGNSVSGETFGEARDKWHALLTALDVVQAL